MVTFHILITCPDINDPETDIHSAVSNGDAIVKPKPKPIANQAKKVRPVTNNSHCQAKALNAADQCDLAANKGSSTQKSN